MHDDESIAPLLAAKRILVLGSSGSGKTTLARQLGRLLRIDPIHLDACFWQPGWISTPQDQWREVVASLVQKEAWIMDGTYESTLHLRVPAADCLIVLESPRLTCLWRVVKRKLTIDDRPPTRCTGRSAAGCRLPALRLALSRRDASVVFDCIRKYGPDKPLIRLARIARRATLSAASAGPRGPRRRRQRCLSRRACARGTSCLSRLTFPIPYLPRLYPIAHLARTCSVTSNARRLTSPPICWRCC